MLQYGVEMENQAWSEIALSEFNRSTNFGNGQSGSPLTNRQPMHQEEEDGRGHGQEFSLPRADGGTDAWLFLAGCFMIEALVWGELNLLL